MCDLFISRDMAPASKYPDCAELQVDERWRIAFNGHQETRKDSQGFEVQPFCCSVWFNGWPAGVFNPVGGCIAAGTAANEDALIEAMERATIKGQA